MFAVRTAGSRALIAGLIAWCRRCRIPEFVEIGATPARQVRLRNTTGRRLWCVLLNLTDRSPIRAPLWDLHGRLGRAGVLACTPVTTPLYVPAGTPPERVPGDDGRVVRVLASARQRVAARVIDLLTAFLVVSAAVSPVYAVALMSSTSFLWVTAPLVVLAMAGPLLLRVGGIVRWGCTLGQRVAGIRVVREEDGTRPPDWRRSFRRYVLPRNYASLPLISDPWVYRKDERLRQCLHDRRAGTVVVRAQAPPAPAETGGPAALGSPGPAGLPDHVRRWEARERRQRIALGSTLGVLGAAVLSAPFAVPLVTAGPSAIGGPAFEVDTFYDDATRFENRFEGRSETYERTAAKVLDDEEGCLAGATSGQTRAVLRRAGCEGRIEIAFMTPDGVLVSGHVLKFPDRASAAGVRPRLRHTDLRFVPDGDVDPPGGARIGDVGTRDRYVVVTTAVSPRQPEAPAKAKNAFLLIHVPTLNVILWF
ncbi:hypothetical protein GWI34_18435 [Actinomadura sp. DSM 109109]|nr:hypothetical protein [Actinomadura lepetitiana]